MCFLFVMKNNINQTIYHALRISEDSGIPLLIMSAPGMGKTSTIEMYAEYRGYYLEVLRGNSTSETEIMGYDVVDLDPEAKSTKHLRPSWFERILRQEKALLFLDELTTAPAPVQASLLHLIFSRTVGGNEKLPDSTLIVSAGNYSQSLSSDFGLIPPLMNRFCIVNILPDITDLDLFLSHYTGNIIGEKKDWKEEVYNSFKGLDQEENDKELVEKASEYIERTVRETAKILISKNKGLDLKVSDMQGIFSDTSLSDNILLGFVSLRTLGYLVKVSISSYKLFGSSGIIGNSTYLKMVEGLVGIGLSRGSSGTIPTVLTKYFYEAISQAILAVEKLRSKKAQEYEEFFRSLKKGLPDEELKRISKTLLLIVKDKELFRLQEPLEVETIEGILNLIVSESSQVSKSNQSLNSQISPEILAGKITRWNLLLDVFKSLWIIIDQKEAYQTSEMETILESVKNSMVSDMIKLDSFIKFSEKSNPESKGLLPKLRTELVV